MILSFDQNDPAYQPMPRPEDLVFLSLGGAGEIGMNLTLYGHAGKWLMVDLGISFADDTMPGVDIIMADPSFIVERRKDLVGLLVTHAHEDHIGAIQHLWPKLRCPIYTTPFTASVIRAKMGDAGLLKDMKLIELPLSARFDLGPFNLELISVTHSVPEPNALVIRTKAGKILHTGDWKFDPDPLIGPTADIAALSRLGEEGIDALVGDSTNALREGVAGSEADVRASLIELVGRFKKRVVIACFASNVARMQSAAFAAAANGRVPALVGRSMLRMEQAARENGYLDDTPAFISDEEADELPADRVLLICTGSQGEPRSALVRIAADDHPVISLDRGDAVIFSSRMIPGNEQAIGRLQNKLVRAGIEVVTEGEEFVHVSGHPARGELSRMYQLVRPRIAIPVHGEARHQQAHAKLAESCQVAHTIIPGNGDMIRINQPVPEVIDHVETGVLGLDGSALVPLINGSFRGRMRVLANGSALVSLVVDRNGKLMTEPRITILGLLGVEEATVEELAQAVGQAVKSLPAYSREDDESIKETARSIVRRHFQTSHGKRPVTDIHVMRL
jgi:ribonuclease J